MTENEALFRIKDLEYECMNSTIHYFTDKDIPMLHIAIKALEEIQQYRAIGTIDEFKDLKEKNVAKKLIVKGVMGFDGEESYCCPNCGLDNLQWGCNRCVDCGQKLDWQ